MKNLDSEGSAPVTVQVRNTICKTGTDISHKCVCRALLREPQTQSRSLADLPRKLVQADMTHQFSFANELCCTTFIDWIKHQEARLELEKQRTAQQSHKLVAATQVLPVLLESSSLDAFKLKRVVCPDDWEHFEAR